MSHSVRSPSRVRIHPVNPAESIIAPFFDPGISPEKEWELQGASGTRNLRLGRVYTAAISWDAAEPGKVAVTWRWRGPLDLSRYNGFFLQAAFGRTVGMRFSAKVDGQWQLVVERRGADHNDDYTGPFHGSTLEELRIDLIPETAEAGGFNAYYLGVHHDRRLQDWLDFENAELHPHDWPEFIKPQSEWGELKPEVGLYFGAEDLEALRRKIARAPYQSFAELLRKQARSYLTMVPEKEIRRYLLCGESPHSYSARARDRGLPLSGRMELCAFFGLLDRDPELIRMAARCAIAAAHVSHWSEGMVEHDFPGSASNWRCFSQNDLVTALANTMDWIGEVLTPHAKETLCHSLFFKGLSAIQYDFARHESIYHMNQAALFSMGRVAGLLTLRKHWPRVGKDTFDDEAERLLPLRKHGPRVDWMLDQAQRDLDEVSNRIIHADGGYGEGPGYYTGVLYYLLPAYWLLARHRAVAVQTLVPPGILKSADYFGLFVSTTRKASRLMLSDSIDPQFYSDTLAMAAQVTGDPRWNRLLAEKLEVVTEKTFDDPINRLWSVHSPRTLIFGPEDLSAQHSPVPVFQIQASSGHATSCRPTPHGLVRLHLSGASGDEGHSHQDKGAIILEGFGEDLLIDRGITVYNDPATPTFKISRMHNLITPLGSDGREVEQINPCPKAIEPMGKGDERCLHLRVDVSAAWPEPVLKMTRAIDSESPLEFTITDEVEMREPAALIFHLHSYAPIQIRGSEAVFEGRRCRLRVSWGWTGEVVRADADFFDYSHTPVHHLAIRSAIATRHHWIIQFELESIDDRILKGCSAPWFFGSCILDRFADAAKQ